MSPELAGVARFEPAAPFVPEPSTGADCRRRSDYARYNQIMRRYAKIAG